jgi:hypothetical protein
MYLDVNHVKTRILNGGDMWWDLVNNSQYEVPYGNNTHALFAGALWMGGLDQNNQLHVAAQTYRQPGIDYFAGPLNADGNTTADECLLHNRMWKVYSSEIVTVINLWNANGGNMLQLNQIPENVLYWPGRNNPQYTATGIKTEAPFYDRNYDGIYNPAYGDYPTLDFCNDFFADQMIFWIINDNGNIHSQSGGVPLKVEIHCMAYAFDNNTCLSDATFYKFKIKNKSQNTYHDFYAGFWIDPELGCYTDDYIGTDSTNNMVYVYNADPYDEPCASSGYYDNQPPLLGIKFLKPLNQCTGKNALTHSMYFVNDFTIKGYPEEEHHYYYYLTSRFKDGTHLTYGNDGYGGSNPVNFVYYDEPNNSNGWSMCSEQLFASDSRIVMSSGPSVLKPGETQSLDMAVLFVQPPVGTYAPCPNITMLKQCAMYSQVFYDVNVCCNTNTAVAPVNKNDNRIFPNPVDIGNEIRLGNYEAGYVELFSIDGRRIYEQPVQADEPISTQVLSVGYYIIRFKANSGAVYYDKLIVK